MKKSLWESVEEAIGRPISGYADVVREERYFCAVLYHCMLSDPEGMQRFLQLCDVKRKEPTRCGVRGVYVEYAMARDLWEKLGSQPKKGQRCANFLKYSYIKSMLNWSPLTEEEEGLLKDGENAEQSIVKFNRHFCTKRHVSKTGPEDPSQLERVSKTDIETPAHWRIASFCKDASRYGICKKHVIETACKMKWAFNVKPDIVIELDNQEAVCVEAKLESGEDSYAQKQDRYHITEALGTDADCFLRDSPKQCEVQAYLMRKVLGLRHVHMVFLSKSVRKKTDQDEKLKDIKDITWSEAYNCFSEVNNYVLQKAQSRIADLLDGKENKGKTVEAQDSPRVGHDRGDVCGGVFGGDASGAGCWNAADASRGGGV